MTAPIKPETVGTTAMKVVQANSRRTALGIANLSTTATLYIGNDVNVSSTNGFPIFSTSTRDMNSGLGDQPELEYWLISDTASTSIAVQESFRESATEILLAQLIKAVQDVAGILQRMAGSRNGK